MGQQQLIVMILVTVVVGIMTIVAITMFQEAQKDSEKTAIRQDLLNSASLAHTYYKKPAMLGGGGGSFQSQSFQISASTLDRSDTLTATINTVGLTWN